MRWFLERIFAALIGAAATGVVAATVLTILEQLTWQQLLFNLRFGPIFSLVFGTIPGVVALTLTPARLRPWRSLPILIVGAAFGFLIWAVVPAPFHLDRAPSEVGLLLMFGIPTTTLLLAAWNIERLPKAFRS